MLRDCANCFGFDGPYLSVAVRSPEDNRRMVVSFGECIALYRIRYNSIYLIVSSAKERTANSNRIDMETVEYKVQAGFFRKIAKFYY